MFRYSSLAIRTTRNSFKFIRMASNNTSIPNFRKVEEELVSTKRIKIDDIKNESNVSDNLSEMRELLSKKPNIWKPLVWIDCEMTGLNVYKDHIIEICCIITDGNLEIIDEQGYESTVYCSKEILDSMNEWCVNQHGKSGLTEKILANPGRTLEKVEEELLAYIKKYVTEKNKAVMAGNSIHMDRFFMQREFPKVIDYLHYRLIDVSSVMEIGYRHNPELMKAFPKKAGNHTARSDILESINQLKWYRSNYLKNEEESKDVIQKFRESVQKDEDSKKT